ncbi:hypothetical protein EIN_183100 [Entamoeba invadens IP1]|uniref:hypothetical protein n=1 Tax=Entamoeba invadens IP1 TaxID=370355 RepID=UPI0002C3E3CA|nr:hypothetical protein EIN_183100 [Entamoeba invadens IP1]ELP94053.1 hypothetical protein EIN_183100 [Entamoeba invadens IP1]|eukprot:XP_004260824.1 hypothetical protein EIN_183100 [Entamoeba invadens IP1]
MSLEKAINIAEVAIDFDNKEQDFDAITKYKEAIYYLKLAHKDPVNAESYSVILDKIVEYSDRITYLADLHPGEANFIELIKSNPNYDGTQQPQQPTKQQEPIPPQPPLPEKTYQQPKPEVPKKEEPIPQQPVQPEFTPIHDEALFNPPIQQVSTIEPVQQKVEQPVEQKIAEPQQQKVEPKIIQPSFPNPQEEVHQQEAPKEEHKMPAGAVKVMPTVEVTPKAEQPIAPVATQPANTATQQQMLQMQQMAQMQQMMSSMGGMQMSYVMTPQGPMMMPMMQQMNGGAQPQFPMQSVNPMQQSQPIFPQFGANGNQTTLAANASAAAPISQNQQTNIPQKPKVPKQSTTASRTAYIRTKLSLQHPSTVNGLKAWKLAKPLAEKGKEFDNNMKYADALAYYETALDYFAQALRAPDLTDTMKKQLREDTKMYLERAETVKPVVTQFLKENPSYFGDYENEDDARLETCIVCNKHIDGEFVNALGYNYHPQCFVANVNCKLCGKPFSFPKMEFKIYNDQAYHPLCFEGVTGLEKEVTYSPMFGKGNIFYKVKLPKKIFNVNESFMYDVTIDNSTSSMINYIEAFLVCEETRFSRSFSGEMKGETTKTEMAKKKIMFEGGMMKNGVVTKSEMFALGMVRPSHHNDIMFYRGYKFVISLKVSGVALGPDDIFFPIYINE